MSRQSRKHLLGACATLLGAALAACKEPTPATVALHGAHDAAQVRSAKLEDVEDVLCTLKHLTLSYRDIAAVKAAGYDAQLTPCMELPPAGGMGFHYTAWTSQNPPTLAGVPFHRNDTFQLWVLHAWIWKHNPSGTLTDWNPRVTCQYAPTNQGDR